MNNLTVVPGPRNPRLPRQAPDLGASLVRLSALEMVSAAGLGGAPAPVRTLAYHLFSALSRKLGLTLARFDADVGDVGLSVAARRALEAFGAAVNVRGPALPKAGSLLIVANHPGAYDALALMTSLGRDDLAILTADRAFLRALPHLAERLFFAGEGGDGAARGEHVRGARALRGALRHLARGGALLQFGAGRIEPDAAFVGADAPLLAAAWSAGTGALVRAAARSSGAVVVAAVARVHSARAKRAAFVRAAEARGVTTLAPLLQIALPGFGDVHIDVTTRDAERAAAIVAVGGDDAMIAERLRRAALAMLEERWRSGAGVSKRSLAETNRSP